MAKPVFPARERPSAARVSCREGWHDAAMAVSVRLRLAGTREGGLASFLPVLGLEDNRWLWFCACSGNVSILGGAFGLPLMDRLFTAIDPSLQNLNESRHAFCCQAFGQSNRSRR